MPRSEPKKYKYPASMLKADGTLSKAPGMAKLQAAYRLKIKNKKVVNRKCKIAYKPSTKQCNNTFGTTWTQRKKANGGFCCRTTKLTKTKGKVVPWELIANSAKNSALKK